MERIDHSLHRKPLFDEFLATTAEPFAKGGILCELDDAAGKHFAIAPGHEEASLLGHADFARSVTIIGDNRSGCRERLRQRAGQPLALREVNENIHDADKLRDLLGRDKAGEEETIAQAGRLGHRFEAFSPPSVADEQEPCVRTATHNDRSD